MKYAVEVLVRASDVLEVHADDEHQAALEAERLVRDKATGVFAAGVVLVEAQTIAPSSTTQIPGGVAL